MAEGNCIPRIKPRASDVVEQELCIKGRVNRQNFNALSYAGDESYEHSKDFLVTAKDGRGFCDEHRCQLPDHRHLR